MATPAMKKLLLACSALLLVSCVTVEQDVNPAVSQHLPVHDRVERVGRGEDRPAERTPLEVPGEQASTHPNGAIEEVVAE